MKRGQLLRLLRGVRLHRDISTVIRQKILSHPAATRPVTYRLRGGPSLTLESGSHDLWVLNEIWLDRSYAVVDGFIPKQGWVVYDLGAHKGVFSCWAATQMEVGRIYAFEPQPSNFDFLKLNTSQFSGIGFHMEQAAVGSSSGHVELFLDREQSGLASIHHDRHSGYSESISVPAIAFHEAIARAEAKIDLVKMDVEGAEHSILEETPSAVFDLIERIVMEYHSRDPRDTKPSEPLQARLESLGFSTLLRPDRSLLFASKSTTDLHL